MKRHYWGKLFAIFGVLAFAYSCSGEKKSQNPSDSTPSQEQTDDSDDDDTCCSTPSQLNDGSAKTDEKGVSSLIKEDKSESQLPKSIPSSVQPIAEVKKAE